VRGATLDHHARQTLQHHLYPTHYVDAAARTVYIAYPNGDTFRRAPVLPEQLSNPPSDVRAIVVIESDTVDSYVQRSDRRQLVTGIALRHSN
jgi:hypothetical protein